MARQRKTNGNYKGGARTIYAPDLIVEEPYNTVVVMYNEGNEKEAWKLYSEMRSIARKREERALNNDLLKDYSIVKSHAKGFPTVKELKASANPKMKLAEAYSDVMTYLASEHTTQAREIGWRKGQIARINKHIEDANGKNFFDENDYKEWDNIGKFFEYVDNQLKKKYGETRWKMYRDSWQIINAMTQGAEYSLDMKDIYKIYIDWKRSSIKKEKQQARRNVKKPRTDPSTFTHDDLVRLAKKYGISTDTLN